jgi:ParB family chromosome partitioning protein
MPSKEAAEAIVNIPLDRIIMDPTQPRKVFDEQGMKELAESIKANGLLQPIRVFKIDPCLYQIEEGERRYRAFQLLELPTIPCIVTEKKSKREITNRRLAENLHRVDLSDAELAEEFKRRADQGETHEEIARSVGKSRAYVSQRILMVEKLPKEVFSDLDAGKISFAEARTLLFEKPTEGTGEKRYAVTMPEILPSLEVPKLFEKGKAPENIDVLYAAYTSDLVKLRRALP